MIKYKILSRLAVLSLLLIVIAVRSARADLSADKESLGKKNNNQISTSSLSDMGDRNLILWSEPRDIANRDLLYGLGGQDGAPDPSSKFTLVGHGRTGKSKELVVEDDKGRGWIVAFGPGAKAEIAAARIVWAAGYHVDQVYFVNQAHIGGQKGFDVQNVRFKRRDDGFKEESIWSWKQNPFSDSHELQGLKVLMALLNNWDLKDNNNKIVRPIHRRDKRIYYVSNLRATLGKAGSVFSKSKVDPEQFAKQEFICDVRNGEILFRSKGNNPPALDGVSVESARWMGNLLRRLSDDQLSDAFRAGGFNNAEVVKYVQTIRTRIKQLQEIQSSQNEGND